MNKEMITKLREHYASLAGVPNWGYEHCASGALKNMGLAHSLGAYAVSDALDITQDQADYIVSGPRSITWSHLTDVKRRDAVVRMLDKLLETGDVDWGAQI